MTNNYYKKKTKKLQKEACKRYQNLSEEEKGKKRQYIHERYRNKIFSRMQEIKTI